MSDSWGVASFKTHVGSRRLFDHLIGPNEPVTRETVAERLEGKTSPAGSAAGETSRYTQLNGSVSQTPKAKPRLSLREALRSSP